MNLQVRDHPLIPTRTSFIHPGLGLSIDISKHIHMCGGKSALLLLDTRVSSQIQSGTGTVKYCTVKYCTHHHHHCIVLDGILKPSSCLNCKVCKHSFYAVVKSQNLSKSNLHTCDSKRLAFARSHTNTSTNKENLYFCSDCVYDLPRLLKGNKKVLRMGSYLIFGTSN